MGIAVSIGEMERRINHERFRPMSILSSVVPMVAPVVSLTIAVLDFREGFVALREGKPSRGPFLKAAVHVAMVAMELVH